jgi:type I restriction enzyme, S subunit
MSVRKIDLGDLIEKVTVKRAGKGQFPILSMTMRNGLVDQNSKFKKRVASSDLSQYKIIKRNQLVVGFPIDEGVLSFQSLYPEAIVSPAYNVWKIRAGNLVNINYLEKFLRSPEALWFYKSKLRGSTARRRSLPDDIFLTFKIPIPPLEEQKRIAAILDKADTLRRKRQQAIDLTDQLLRSVFLDMFGNPVTNPKGWKLVKFASVGQLDRGKSKHRPRNDPVLLGGNHPLIQTGDVANSGGYITTYNSTYSEVGLKQSKKWAKGTLCITIAANIANTGILEFDSCFPDSVVGFTPNDSVTVEYVQAWLVFLQKIIEDAAPESAQKNINLAILRNLEIPLPGIETQKKFSQIVHQVKKTKGNLINGETKIQRLFSSLTQQAFRGDTPNKPKPHKIKTRMTMNKSELQEGV